MDLFKQHLKAVQTSIDIFVIIECEVVISFLLIDFVDLVLCDACLRKVLQK